MCPHVFIYHRGFSQGARARGGCGGRWLRICGLQGARGCDACTPSSRQSTVSFISRGFFWGGWGVRTVTFTSRSSPFRFGVVGDFDLASRLFFRSWCGARSLAFHLVDFFFCAFGVVRARSLFISLIFFFVGFCSRHYFCFADSLAMW